MKTVVAMSGGVDSSVAAARLAESGRELIGVSLQTHDLAQGGGFGRCCSPDDFRDARRVAGRLGIPYYVFDEEEVFARTVIAPFVDAYRAGRTPSPCVLCNGEVKFGTLLDKASALGADRVATGHYARLATEGRATLLLRANDRAKDQSYFLFGLTQHQLAHAEFPVGDLTKEEVREEARRLDLPVAEKPESQEICFIEGSSYRDFVRDRSGDLGPSGEIVDRTGARVGTHEGIAAFTVGQRRGIGLPGPEALYVIAIEPAAGRVVVGPEDAVRTSVCTLDGVNWIPADRTGDTLSCEVRIRHRHAGAPARVTALPGRRARIEFETPQRAVAPGQAAVLYQDDLVLGGGWIEGRDLQPH